MEPKIDDLVEHYTGELFKVIAVAPLMVTIHSSERPSDTCITLQAMNIHVRPEAGVFKSYALKDFESSVTIGGVVQPRFKVVSSAFNTITE